MCNGHLREWDESDNPWIEHAKFFPNCLYLRNMKGDAFVAEICRNLEHLPKDNRNRVITQRSFTTADHVSFAGQPGQAGFSNSLPEVFSSSGQSTFSSSHHPSGFSNPNNLTGLTNSSQRAFLNTGQVEFSNSGERPIFRLPYHSNISSCMDPILDELRLLPDVKGPVNRTAAASSHLSTTEHRQLQQPQAQHHQVPVPPVQPSWSSQETNSRLFGSIHTSVRYFKFLFLLFSICFCIFIFIFLFLLFCFFFTSSDTMCCCKRLLLSFKQYLLFPIYYGIMSGYEDIYYLMWKTGEGW